MSWSPDAELPPTDPEVLASYISALSASHPEISTELEALESIYPSAIRILPPKSSRSSPALEDDPFYTPVPPANGERIRYQITIPGWEDDDAPRVRVLVSLPPDYPESAPQLMLLGRYVGNFAIDSGLFGDITRTFITSTGVPFTPGEVCIFDGLMHVQSLVGAWHEARVSERDAHEAVRAAERSTPVVSGTTTPAEREPRPRADLPDVLSKLSLATDTERPLPKITSSEPIVDRKSAFVGHAARIKDEADVANVVRFLLTDKKIAKAAHPTIWAYRVVREVGGAAGRVVESDYDDDGETQAGSRLKHLLEILELENVLVVVSRWYGGTLLGPDRFKHINQAARDALEGAGLLEEPVAAGKKKGRR